MIGLLIVASSVMMGALAIRVHADFDDDFDVKELIASSTPPKQASNVANNIPPPYCDNALCPGGTCCLDDKGKPSCFKGLNDTCCGYDNSACPSGTVCDPIKNDCAHTSNTTVCLACQTVVHTIISKGCTYACNVLPPPVDVICDFIVARANLCEKILNWTTAGVSPVSICSEIGLCSGPTCDCGYCTQYTSRRCLAINAKCPKNNQLVSSFDDDELSGDVQANDDAAGPVCFTGHCDSSSYGCCLTCW